MRPLQLKFDPDQKHQLDAIDSVVHLFNDMPRHEIEFALGEEVVANLPVHRALSESWIYDNLQLVQAVNDIQQQTLMGQLDVDDGMVLDGAGYESWRYSSFTIEMETGTGKTYVYLRMIYELRQHYGFSKFIVVVPSIAIYEGVIKNFAITQRHFRALYGNETVHLVRYDSSKLNQLRAFATSTFAEVLVMTIDSFNRKTNRIFKPSEQLPGERLPFQYLQETRPILILDEPQNMESERAKEALRTLHPLFALRYSATHRTSPNLLFRLTPFEAYRQNLVKKIQVFGVTEQENFNVPFLALREITVSGGIRAKVRTYVYEKGRPKESDITLKHGDDLQAKTKREEHSDGYVVIEINETRDFVEFENGLRLTLNETIGPSRPAIFRRQIRETIKQHMEQQDRLERLGIKVLSLFFIDRVANYIEPDGLIKRIFDEEYKRQRGHFPFYADWNAEDVREAYFAKRKPKKGEGDSAAIDTTARNKAERAAEKAAFKLIMKDKERLLSFGEKVCFIFAHSALKEGWDNPNVFQICTLNQTVSEMKKRQEIGRGLRLAVNQDGERVFDEEVNLLSVIANESYDSYARGLQTEYVEAGGSEPPPPRNARDAPAKRNDQIFESQAFAEFWAQLQRKSTYQIHIDASVLVKECVRRISGRKVPEPVVVVQRGRFVVTEYILTLEDVSKSKARITVASQDTAGNESSDTRKYKARDDLARMQRDERLRGFKIAAIGTDRVDFANGESLEQGVQFIFQSEQGQRVAERAELVKPEKYPVFNIIDRAAKETGLTRATLNQVFKNISSKTKRDIFGNPEGFAAMFIGEINNALGDHVAARIEFTVDGDGPDADLDELFPPVRRSAQHELIPASEAGLYDQVQIDSDVEKKFVRHRLNEDDAVLFYFKFPPVFKIPFPHVIGNYNPDWGIARLQQGGEVVLQLVRETKGTTDVEALQFAHEKRKIRCARKIFAAMGIDYRPISDETVRWWEPDEHVDQEFMDL